MQNIIAKLSESFPASWMASCQIGYYAYNLEAFFTSCAATVRCVEIPQPLRSHRVHLQLNFVRVLWPNVTTLKSIVLQLATQAAGLCAHSTRQSSPAVPIAVIEASKPRSLLLSGNPNLQADRGGCEIAPYFQMRC